jgi:hypothetical protein
MKICCKKSEIYHNCVAENSVLVRCDAISLVWFQIFWRIIVPLSSGLSLSTVLKMTALDLLKCQELHTQQPSVSYQVLEPSPTLLWEPQILHLCNCVSVIDWYSWASHCSIHIFCFVQTLSTGYVSLWFLSTKLYPLDLPATRNPMVALCVYHLTSFIPTGLFSVTTFFMSPVNSKFKSILVMLVSDVGWCDAWLCLYLWCWQIKCL